MNFKKFAEILRFVQNNLTSASSNDVSDLIHLLNHSYDEYMLRLSQMASNPEVGMGSIVSDVLLFTLV